MTEIGIIYTQILQEAKDLSNDTQLRVIGSMKPETCTKMLRNFNEKVRAKFPVTTHGYSMVKIACLDDAFSKLFELQASPVKGQTLQQKDKKRRRKGEKNYKETKSLEMYITLNTKARYKRALAPPPNFQFTEKNQDGGL